MNKKNIEIKTIMFSGGGTGGSVSPLLAVAQELNNRLDNIRLVFVGGKDGPEREMISFFNQDEEILEYVSLLSGKWRRYFSLYNIIDIFKIIIAFFSSFIILIKFKPKIVISAGSFVSVPLVWAAALLNIPILIHQQDLRAGLANRLMAPWATIVTVTFKKSQEDYGQKARLIGNPINLDSLSDKQISISSLRQKYKLDRELPLVLVMGGGTGSLAINRLLEKIALRLSTFSQIFHLTGRGKSVNLEEVNNYQSREFISHQDALLLEKEATLVISRCGLGVLSELSALAKAAILIPLPHTHQEDNARVFAEKKAAIVLEEDKIKEEEFVKLVQRLLSNISERLILEKNIFQVIKRGARENMSELIINLLNK